MGQSKLTRQLVEAGLAPLKRQDGHGVFRAMAAAEGYVMVRRTGCIPFVIRERDWLQMREAA